MTRCRIQHFEFCNWPVFFIDKFVHRNKHLGKEKICLKLSFENHQLFPKYYDNITIIIIKFNNLQ